MPDRPKDFGTVGVDVVQRAADRVAMMERFPVASVDEMSAGVDGDPLCVVCRARPFYGGAWRRAMVGGRDVAVCGMCAAMAVTATDYHPDLRACLVGLACQVERIASDVASDGLSGWHDPETGEVPNGRVVAGRIAERFRLGVYASLCGCPAHASARAGVLPDFDPGIARGEGETPSRPSSGLGPGEVPEVRDVSLFVLKSFKPSQRVTFHGVPMEAGEVVDALKAMNAAGGAFPGIRPEWYSATALRFSTVDAALRWRAFHARERAAAGDRPERYSGRPDGGPGK